MDVRYTKSELKESEMFKRNADVIEALFDEEDSYSIEEAKIIIENFMKGCV